MKRIIEKALKGIVSTKFGRDEDILLLPTKDFSFGDFYTPVAMRLSKVIKRPAPEIATELADALRSSDAGELIDKAEAAGPGFVNISFSSKAILDFMRSVIGSQELPAKGFVEDKRKILLEYVSANPTGPLSVAHARQAAIGDSLVRIMRYAGHNVDSEYYLNNVGVQIELLGRSLKERCKEIIGSTCLIPEGGYKGAYLKELAAKFLSVYRDKIGDIENIPLEEFSRFAVGEILGIIKDELYRFGVSFDNWFSQEAMEKGGEVKEALAILKERGFIYEKDGAVWFASSRFGDDKDRVVVKSDGSNTYFTADIAYHRNKFQRGYNRVIDMWGPDHHGYIARVKAAIDALGYNPELFNVIIVQLVTLYKDGKPLAMSTRQGEYIPIDELMDEVGVDAARFFLLMRRTSSHLDFDIDLARKQAPENPVYYVQYAYARACRIMEMAGRDPESVLNALLESGYPDKGSEREEREIISLVLRFQSVIEACLFDLDPYPMNEYLRTFASGFHRFYERCRVISEDNARTAFRLGIVEVSRVVLRSGLELLGVSAPERM